MSSVAELRARSHTTGFGDSGEQEAVVPESPDRALRAETEVASA